MVLAHVVLPADFRVEELQSLDTLRTETLNALRKVHAASVLDMEFTTDPVWGAPSGSGAGT